MSEYIEVEAELREGGVILFETNLPLAGEEVPEAYRSPSEMEEGSPLAQALATVGGVLSLQISANSLLVQTEADADWHVVIADVTAVLKDFFL